MAELLISQDERGGIAKEIDEGAIDLIFQAMQEDIYSSPIKSFVRESISNGLDSITERDIARKIINGSKVEEFYLQRTDDKLLKDSQFDPSYYNAAHLSSCKYVDVVYTEGTGRDSIIIKDQGVGLAGNRLKGFFKLGYSSKRNLKAVIGKFGAGAKAGLATGVEYFVMRTVYNGYETSFMVFKHDYEPITPETPNSKVEEWNVKMSDGSMQLKKIFWSPTSESNGVTITLEVKKHNRDAFITAVKSQFQYFKNRVKFTYPMYAGSTYMTTTFMDSEPKYESDTLILPSYSTYAVPHILVDGISYGPISWEELELQKRIGTVAIKVKATEVDITQSRESLKWTDRTKKVILNAVDAAEKEASAYISDLIQVDDENNLFDVNTVYGKLTKESGDEVSNTFAKFLDMQKVIPSYTLKYGDLTIPGKLDQDFFDFLFYRISFKRIETRITSSKVSITSTDIKTFQELRNSKIVFAEEASLGPKLANHLMQKFGTTSFVYARTRLRQRFNMHYGANPDPYYVEDIKDAAVGLLQEYSDLVLDEYDVHYDEKEMNEEDSIDLDVESAADIRKKNKMLLYTMYDCNYSTFTQNRYEVGMFGLSQEFENTDNLIICTGSYKALGQTVQRMGYIMGKPVNIIYVAQDVLQHFLPYGTFITDYFRKVNIKTGELMIGEAIKDLNTYRKVCEIFEKYPGMHTHLSKYADIVSFDVTQVRRIINNSGAYLSLDWVLSSTDAKVKEDITSYLKVLADFQDVVKTGDKDSIVKASQTLFQTDKIHHINAYDEEFISTLESELERISCIAPLFANLDSTISEESKKLLEILILTLNTKKEDDFI